MSAVLARRTAAVVAAAAIAAGAPALGGIANATTGVTPDFAHSAFVTGGDPTDFPTVQQTPFNEVQTAQVIRVEFTGAIKLVQAGNLLPGNNDNDVSQASYLINTTTNAHLSGSSTVDPNDSKRLLFSPDNSVPDGTYELHVAALSATNCPDAQPTDLQMPACDEFNSVVSDPSTSQPFSFRFDLTGPTPTVDTVNSGNPITANGVKNVQFSGTTDNDTKSMTAYVKGTTIVGNRAIAPVTIGNSGTAWHASDDLSDLPNGTYAFYVTGTDYAGNKSTTPASKPFTIAAHPTAPRHVAVKPGDAAATVSWRTPTETGGSPITAYEVVADDTTTTLETQPLALVYCNGTDCPHSAKVTGLTNGHRYGFSVFAITDVGNGDPATVFGVPKWNTTLTVLGKKSVVKGASLALTGRLSHTTDGKGVKDALVVVTPHYDNGTVGDSFKVKTDSFGTWSKAVQPRHSVRYVAHFAGDAKDQPSSGHLHVDVV